jgi:hypothetical protein
VSLSAEGGWCALDAKRRPLTGFEQRGCWRERPLALPSPPGDPGGGERPRRWSDVSGGEGGLGVADDDARPRARLEFIPVDLPRRATHSIGPDTHADAGSAPEQHTAPQPLAGLEADDGWTDRTSLFGELEA